MIERRKNFIYCPKCRQVIRKMYPIMDKYHEQDEAYPCDVCTKIYYKSGDKIMTQEEYREFCREFNS